MSFLPTLGVCLVVTLIMLLTQPSDSLTASNMPGYTVSGAKYNDHHTPVTFGNQDHGYIPPTPASSNQTNHSYTTTVRDTKPDHAFSTPACITHGDCFHVTSASVVTSSEHNDLPTHKTTILSTGEIWRCLQENATLSLTEIEHLSISYFQSGSAKRQANDTTYLCTVHITSSGNLEVKILEQTCTSRFPVDHFKRLPVWVNDSMYDNYVDLRLRFSSKTATDHWTGCESVLDPLFTTIKAVSEVTTLFTVRDGSIDYRVHINITSSPRATKVELDLHFVSPTLGV
ncbi:hypothetical protein BaRGS_00005867 [Batillaria attramentaria]|uniref:Uncharacterized protein n=1 Tax=Batillaria attramentaria TaxID=370345 RepID=A0ABD0LUN8_9CAEN